MPKRLDTLSTQTSSHKFKKRYSKHDGMCRYPVLPPTFWNRLVSSDADIWPAAADIIYIIILYRMSVKKPCPLIRGKGRRVACRPLAGRIVGARWVARRRVAGTRSSLRQLRRASDAPHVAPGGPHTHTHTPDIAKPFAEFAHADDDA